MRFSVRFTFTYVVKSSGGEEAVSKAKEKFQVELGLKKARVNKLLPNERIKIYSVA